MADSRDPFEPTPIEIEVEPTVAGRLARRMGRARILQTRADAARSRHTSIDFGFSLVERDSSIGGGLLAGALAYRLFVLLLPTSLLLVSGLGLYAGVVEKSPGTVAREAGLNGLIASEVAQAASGRNRAVVFVLMIPPVLYALVTLYRAIAKVHAIVWLGSGRRVRVTPSGVGVLAGAPLSSSSWARSWAGSAGDINTAGWRCCSSMSCSSAARGSRSPSSSRTATLPGMRWSKARCCSAPGC